MTWNIVNADCRQAMRDMPEKSVHCVVTSPPYWGLRKYEGVEPTIWGGDETCRSPHGFSSMPHSWKADGCCGACSAWLGCLGLEPTPDLYVQHIVECFRQVRRVLRDDGTCWVNLGDMFSGGNNTAKGTGALGASGLIARGRPETRQSVGLKPKDLTGMPWRVAFALQADGWYLRSDIIWHKPDPLPESVTDRPTRAHEYLFLLTKKPRYFYDAEAIREPGMGYGQSQRFRSTTYTNNNAFDKRSKDGTETGGGKSLYDGGGRNKRSVWTIPTYAFPAAHFATFPPKLVEPCILAGTSEKGCCPTCGAPWGRIVERIAKATRPINSKSIGQDAITVGHFDPGRHVTETKTVGWRPGCKCNAGEPVAASVLDPFCGSGTVGIVCGWHGRDLIGIDASAEYCSMAEKRIRNPEPIPIEPDMPGQALLFEELMAE